MRRDTLIPINVVRDTLEYAEAKTLLEQKADLTERLSEIKIALQLLRRLSYEAVLLAQQDVDEHCNDNV